MTHGVAAACLGGLLAIGAALPLLLATGPGFPIAPGAGGGAASGEVQAAIPERVPAAHPPDRLDVNRATEAELQSVPGVGPVLASRILASRETEGPFRSAADLLRVPGIGPKRLARMLEHLRMPEQP